MGSVAQRQRSARGFVPAREGEASSEHGMVEAGVEKLGEALEGKPRPELESSLDGEYGNIFLLLVLYTLQGIPLGLASVLPMILKERGVSFSEIGTFSMNSYPFSLKILWAPIVDAAFIPSFGRRKTWMVPAQLLIGIVMLTLSFRLDELLYVEKPWTLTLTGVFFLLHFLCATQDIAVDGWALTMLRRENVGYAATCNAIGQTLGYTLGFTGFMLLEHQKLVDLATFIFFCGICFVVVTLAVAVMKEEAPVPLEDQPDDIPTAYGQMLDILKLRAIRSTAVVLFTWKIAFSIESLAPLKFQEYGVPKEHLAFVTSTIMPLYILLPAVVAKLTSSGEPLDLALRVYPLRVVVVALTTGLVCSTPAVMDPVPWGFYALLMLVTALGVIASQCMFVSQMAFFARVSDPAMGGTYMTLLNTLGNLGGMWPPTVAMKLVDLLTCTDDTCLVKVDGFFVMAGICCVAGAGWCFLGLAPARRLQHLKASEWRAAH